MKNLLSSASILCPQTPPGKDFSPGRVPASQPTLGHRTSKFTAILALITLLAGSSWSAEPATPQPSAPPPAAPPKPPSKFRDFDDVTKGTEKFDGLFTLYRTNETLFGEIKPNQLNKPFLAPITIARGMAMAGQPLNFGDEWILVFRRVDDKIQLVRRNIHYKAPARTPLEKAVEQNYTDSVLMALPIVSQRGGSVLIDFSQIFFSDFANLRLGAVDRNRTTWHKIKTFSNNVELEVETTYMRGPMMYSGFGDDGVADARGLTVVIHYSLADLPDSGYRPRAADYRVGQFISATKDFGSLDPDSNFVRLINRWRLEKSDPKSKISPPKKQMVWWVEDTVPQEYRPYVEEGILEWNKAFEKIGFRNAIAVRWQNERDDFDPEDINYCTFRWITTSSTFAMSGLRANPITGEMIDGDVIFDASWIRAWKAEYAYLVGAPPGAEKSMLAPLAVGEVISPIMAAKSGFGLPFPFPGSQWGNPFLKRSEGQEMATLVPSQWSPLQIELSKRFGPGNMNFCQCLASKQYELSLAAIALANVDKADPSAKLPEDFLGQAIKEVVMHEVGHSLGLRHNFKASTMLNLDQINDPAITHEKGLSGSVMDYNPINIARKGEKQGDYASTTIGPYDYWAIEYAYKPIDGDETAELKKIAARSPEHQLAYATDEDMFLGNDPEVNVYDLGSDPLKYAQSRVALAADLLKGLDEKIVKDGESWSRLRRAFTVLFGQYGNAAYLATSYIGGEASNRDFKGSEKARDPIVPVSADKQRQAMKFVTEQILSDRSFQFSPSLLRRLGGEHWYHWGSQGFYYGGSDYSVYDRVTGIQRIVLNHCFDSSVLSRLQNQALLYNSGENPLTIAEVFRTLTDSIWSELPASGPNTTAKLTVSTIRRNLQREHLRRLSTLVLGQHRNAYDNFYSYIVFFGNTGSYPADSKSLARLHLSEISSRIGKTLDEKNSDLDDTTRAHLLECRERVKKVLEGTYTVND